MKQTNHSQDNNSPVKHAPILMADVNQLKARFLADMELAGLTAGSRRTYLDAVERLVRFYWCNPAELTESQVNQYLLERHRSNTPKGTFKVIRFSLRFLFIQTLGRDWQLFKKKWHLCDRCGCQRFSATAIVCESSMPSSIRYIVAV